MSDERPPPESLLPYDAWTEEALRHVVLRALRHVIANGLPGEHHFYLTFRTDFPGVEVPPRLKAQYPQEMTIVLQNQFWDLVVDEPAETVSVRLSFGGVPAHLRIPLAAVSAFTDPYVRFGLRFRVEREAANAPETEPEPPTPEVKPGEGPQVVSLDSFRRRTPPKDQEPA